MSGSIAQRQENFDLVVQKNALKLVMVASPLKRSSDVSSEFSTPQMPDVRWKLKAYTPSVTPRREEISVFLISSGVKVLQKDHPVRIRSSLSILDETSRAVLGKFDATMTVDHVNSVYYLGYFKRDKAPVRVEANIDILQASDNNSGLSITTIEDGMEQHDPSTEAMSDSDSDDEDEDGEGDTERRLHRAWLAKHEELFNDTEFADCFIEVEGERIPAHKCILAHYSPLMFYAFTLEGEDFDTLKAEGSTTLMVKTMLRYLYTGRVHAKVLADAASLELLTMADEYELSSALKSDLEERFVSQVNTHNVLSFVRPALTMSAPKLKKACFTLIAESLVDVVNTEEWQETKRDDPAFIAQLLELALMK